VCRTSDNNFRKLRGGHTLLFSTHHRTRWLWRVAGYLHSDTRLLSSPNPNTILIHSSRNTKGSFIDENMVVTRCLITFKSLDHDFTELLPFHFVITRQFLYKMEVIWLKLKSLSQHRPYCSLWEIKFPTVSYIWLSRNSHDSFTKPNNNFHTNTRPVSTFTDTPLVYRYPMPNSVWAKLRLFITTRRSEMPLNSFRRPRLVKSQVTLCLLYLRRHFTLIVIGAPHAPDMLTIVVDNTNSVCFHAVFRLFHVCICICFENTLIYSHANYL
jgi:hypothetical protein